MVGLICEDLLFTKLLLKCSENIREHLMVKAVLCITIKQKMDFLVATELLEIKYHVQLGLPFLSSIKTKRMLQ